MQTVIASEPVIGHVMQACRCPGPTYVVFTVLRHVDVNIAERRSRWCWLIREKPLPEAVDLWIFPTFAIANECCANYNPSLYTDSSLSCCSRICIDADLVMQTHVQRTVSRCFAVLRQLRQIRHSVPTDTFQTLVVSLVLTRLNYGDSVLWPSGLLGIRRLQSVLNAAARLTYHLRRSDHISDALACLHWLRVP